MSVLRVLLSTAVLLLWGAAAAQAAVTVFTDRTSWESTVGSFLTEDFNALSNTSFVTGINSAGLIDVGITGSPGNNGIDDGTSTSFDVDGTRFLVGNQDTNEVGDPAATFLFGGPIIGFAADWDSTTTGDGLNITIAGMTVSFSSFLGGSGDGFLGFVSDTVFSSAAFGTDVSSGIGEGFALDNLSIATATVPEPATFGLLAVALAVLGGARHRRARN